MDKVLFYLQPQTLRNDSKAFEWIFLKYKGLADELVQRGVRPAFLVDDELKNGAASFDHPIFSPSEFGISFCRTDWPAYGADIFTNERVEAKDRLLGAVAETFGFRTVCCWNFDARLDRFCRKIVIATTYQELCLVRSPLLYQMDFEGLLWKSSLPSLYRRLRKKVEVDDWILERFLRRFKSEISHSWDEVRETLSLDRAKATILIPL